jgi:hypothetical protein
VCSPYLILILRPVSPVSLSPASSEGVIMGKLDVTFFVFLQVTQFFTLLVRSNDTTAPFHHQTTLPISTILRNFSLSTIRDFDDVQLISLSEESKASLEFSDLNTSIHDPDLTLISASVSIQFKTRANLSDSRKHRLLRLCSSHQDNERLRHKDKPISLIQAQLSSAAPVATTTTPTPFILPHDYESNITTNELESCGNTSSSCSFVHSDYETSAPVGNETATRGNENPDIFIHSVRQEQQEPTIYLSYTCDEDTNTLKIDVLPVLRQWLQLSLECRNKEDVSDYQHEALNLESFAFRLVPIFFVTEIDVNKKLESVDDEEDELLTEEDGFRKQPDMNLNLRYFIDRKSI